MQAVNVWQDRGIISVWQTSPGASTHCTYRLHLHSTLQWDLSYITGHHPTAWCHIPVILALGRQKQEAQGHLWL